VPVFFFQGFINAGIAHKKEAYNEVESAVPYFEDINRPKLNESNGFKPTSTENDLVSDPDQTNLPGDTNLDGYEVSGIKDKVVPFGSKLPSCIMKNQKAVIVVGAGPSGLAAARHLHHQGFCITVLEARDRIGGRVYTDRTSLSVPVDLGASIITGVEADVATERQPDPSSLVCSQLGLELTVLNSDCPLYDLVTGEKVPPDLDEAMESEYNTLLDEMALLVTHHGEMSAQLSLEHGLEYGLRKHRSSGFAPSFIECDGLDEIGKSKDGTDVLTPIERRVMNWHFAHLEYGCATMLKEVSLPHWNQDDAYGGFGGAHCMIKGGFSTVVENLAKGLDIRLSQVVSEVHYEDVCNGKKVKVCTLDGSEFEGDAVLVTVPLGCLKAGSIKFSPDLPDWKKMSIKRLGFGVLNKVILEFPSVFWDETVDYFGATSEETDLRGRCFMFWNVKKTCDAPVLIALVAGKAAVDGQSISPADHVAHAMMVLRRIFSNVSVPDPVGSVVTNWGSEPFTRGSYSYVAVGASGEDYDILGRPVANCLFFAGEATCKEHPDTVGGAMLSGVREAVRIMDLLHVGRDFVAEVEALETASKTTNKRSDLARNEVKNMSRRLEACDLSSTMYPSVSKEALLREMFFNAKTTSGRLHLAKELLQLPVVDVKSFAGSKEGLGTLNSWILVSLNFGVLSIGHE
jgi:monoamine oxidase